MKNGQPLTQATLMAHCIISCDSFCSGDFSQSNIQNFSYQSFNCFNPHGDLRAEENRYPSLAWSVSGGS